MTFVEVPVPKGSAGDNAVRQDGASAGGDVVGRDKVIFTAPVTIDRRSVVRATPIEQLLAKLREEMRTNAHVAATIECLQRFSVRRSHDGIEGLEAKLGASGRDAQLEWALEQKERFAKLLERWSLYESAQEIFAFLLGKAEYEFNTFILPKLGQCDADAINQLMDERIVHPTVHECGAEIFVMDPAIAMGMVFWLAEQCFVRWHV